MPTAPKVAVIIYSLYGHIAQLAEAERAGIIAAGGKADIFQVPEILTKMHAPPKPPYPIASPSTLLSYDAFLFGVPTRFGNMPAQFKAFWDATGRIWAEGGLNGKYAGIFVSTSSPGGGQETTGFTLMTTLVHQGVVFVPLGYASGLAKLVSFDEVTGGSLWGAGTFAAPDGSRKPTERELDVAYVQGRAFWDVVSCVDWSEPKGK